MPRSILWLKAFPRIYNVIGEEAQKELTVAGERGPASDLARFVSFYRRRR